jgi:hypothetical protein
MDALALPGRRGKSGRRELAKSVTQVLAETVELPWLQQIPVHRRFSVSIYPDNHNLAYPAYLRRKPQATAGVQGKLIFS